MSKILLSRYLCPVALIAAVAGACTSNASNHQATNTPMTTAQLPTPSRNPEDGTPRIDPDEAKRLVQKGKAVFVDVRGTDSFNREHIKGALEFSGGKIEKGEFQGLPKDTRIITYCS